MKDHWPSEQNRPLQPLRPASRSSVPWALVAMWALFLALAAFVAWELFFRGQS